MCPQSGMGQIKFSQAKRPRVSSWVCMVQDKQVRQVFRGWIEAQEGREERGGKGRTRWAQSPGKGETIVDSQRDSERGVPSVTSGKASAQIEHSREYVLCRSCCDLRRRPVKMGTWIVACEEELGLSIGRSSTSGTRCA